MELSEYANWLDCTNGDYRVLRFYIRLGRIMACKAGLLVLLIPMTLLLRTLFF